MLFCVFLSKWKKQFSNLRQLEEINGDAMMKQADTMVQVASEFVETLTEENVDN